MQNTQKIAISIPKEDFKKIEALRKHMGVHRSTIIDIAIKFWLKSIEKEEMIRQYEQGYINEPESVEEVKVFEKLAAEAFEAEGWE